MAWNCCSRSSGSAIAASSLRVAEPHRTFEVHPAELAGGPRDAEQRRLQRSAGHGLRAEAVALAEDDRPERHGQVGAGDEHPADMADGGARFVLGSDHEPRRVAQEHDRQIERVAQLQEAGGLVGAVGVDRTAEMRGIVGDDARRPAFDPRQRGDHARRPTTSQLEHRPVSTHGVDHGAHVVHADAVLGNEVAKQPLVGAGPRRVGSPLKYERYCFAAATAAGSSSTAMSMTPLATCTSNGPMSPGSYTPSPPPSIIAGPPIPMFVPATPMTTSQQPSSAALPAKQ